MEATYDDAVVSNEQFPGGNQHIAKFTISGMPDKGTGGEIPRIRVFLTQDHSGVLRAQSALYMEEKVEQPEDEDVTMKDESKEGNEEAAKKEGEEGEKPKEDEAKKTEEENKFLRVLERS